MSMQSNRKCNKLEKNLWTFRGKFASSFLAFSYPGGGNGKQRDIALATLNLRQRFFLRTQLLHLNCRNTVPRRKPTGNCAPVHAPCPTIISNFIGAKWSSNPINSSIPFATPQNVEINYSNSAEIQAKQQPTPNWSVN